MSSVASHNPPVAIILAAGKGTRMRSDLPKVVHPVGGEAMVNAVVEACVQAGCARVVLVVGYKQGDVRHAVAPRFAAWASRGARIEFVEQAEQLGTGHAVRCAEALLARESAVPGAPVFVLCGDGPLIRRNTLDRMLRHHREAGARATLATSVLDDPRGYGRIVRDASGRFMGIVEDRNCTPEQRAIREVNPSYYCFDAAALFGALGRVTRNAGSGEYYLTDVPALLASSGGRVEVIEAVPAEDVLSINTPEDLARVDAIYRSRRDGSGQP
ncbi:MAG: NTP transferase domain-containing protein [Phycisphaerae bacterium]|nr:NTP transferase domain-containing protein [Phycisphaerae bacterium]